MSNKNKNGVTEVILYFIGLLFFIWVLFGIKFSYKVNGEETKVEIPALIK